MTDQLVDPTTAYLAQDPTVLGQVQSVPTQVDDPHHAARDLSIAIIGSTLLMRRLLRAKPVPEPTKAADQARELWDDVAPAWLRVAVPAVRHAYQLGQMQGLTEEELQQLATDYAGALGDYVNESSAEALQAGMEAQLAQRWSGDLAWHRAVEGYGLDRRSMLGYIRQATKDGSSQLIPAAARAAVDRAFMLRVDNLGEQEAYSAAQCGQVLAWMLMERDGRIPAGSQREWEMGANEQHCATCLELAGQLVPLHDPFLFVNGAKIWAPRAHPGCYCRVRLRPPEIIKRDTNRDTRITVAGIALRAADTGRVLMLQRAQDPKDPAGGLWEVPGGHLERGESPEQGAWREWSEEVRRRKPAATPVSSWTHGIYQGFVYEIPYENAIPSHRRGSVTNPDDPDGDAVEAIAWWDPDHLAGNKAVRPELLEALREARSAMRAPLAKAYDPREKRATNGRWATTITVEKPIAEEQAATEAPSLLAPASAFLGTKVLLGAPQLLSESLLAPEKTQASAGQAFLAPHKPKPRIRIVHDLSHRVVLLPIARPAKAANPDTYYLGVDQFHEATPMRPIGGRYDLDEEVDFDRATAHQPMAHAHVSPWNLLSDDHVFADKVSSNYVDRQTIEDHWSEIVPLAKHAFNIAMSDFDTPDNPIRVKLREDDYRQIFTLAGYDPGASLSSMQRQLKDAVGNVDLGDDDSLAMAYGDYVTWVDPQRFLGRYTGGELERALDDAEHDHIELRHLLDLPVPTEQVFAFEKGLHPGTNATDGAARIRGSYVSRYHRYRSALHDFGTPPPLRIGLRETYMEPYTPGPESRPGGH